MIVLDANLFAIEPASIDQVKVLRTIVGGRVVYDRPEDGNQDLDPDQLLDRTAH